MILAIEERGVYPELACVPIFRESLHAQLALEFIFSLRFEIFKLLLARISFTVKFLQGIESPT